MHGVARIVLFLIGVGVLVVCGIMLLPVPKVWGGVHAENAPDAGSSAIDPAGQSIELIQPGLAPEAIVFLHGMTSSPRQFEKLGRELFARGATVLIPRMPFHGYTDRMTPKLRNFTAQVMLDEANRTIDRAKTLGRRVTVAGLSVNGVTAAWVAMNRQDVDTVLVMAPFFAARGMPTWSVVPTGRLFLRLPNAFVWWDREIRKGVGEGTLTYPRFATRAMAGILLFGDQVLRQAETTGPAVRRVVIVTSASDTAVENRMASELAARWRKDGTTNVETYEFPIAWEVPHDFVDPAQPDQRIKKVYPVLIGFLESETPSP